MHQNLEVAYIATTDVIPYANNPRTHSEQQVAQVAASIKEFGFNNPILLDEHNGIIAGHGRLAAAQKLGMELVPTITLAGLTEAQKKAYVIADNKLTENGGWDYDLLAVEIERLKELDVDIDLTGFDPTELDTILEPEVVEGLTDEDEVPEAPEEPITKRGDVWILGNHRLMCGDSTSVDDVDKLMAGQKADMVFTDPPYGIEFQSEAGDKIKNDDLNDSEMKDFNSEWQSCADLVAKGDCFLLAWQSPRKFHLLDFDGPWKFFRLVTMYKSNRISFPHGAWINKTEPCCVFSKGSPRITKQNYMDDCFVYKHDKKSHEDSNVGHPTPKPVVMIEGHVKACAKADDLVLDLFGGSGSTMIACEKTGRRANLMELDPKYCDVIVDRWQSFTGKTAQLERPLEVANG